jgi:hypothetical protein
VKKYDKAGLVSRLGEFGRTFDALWYAIPESARRRLTGAELGDLVRAMHSQVAHGEAKAEDEAVQNGAIFHRCGKVYDVCVKENMPVPAPAA